jgi:hypothetical protein
VVSTGWWLTVWNRIVIDPWLGSYLERESSEQLEYEQELDYRGESDDWVLKPNGDEDRVDDWVNVNSIPRDEYEDYGIL